ncbi:MAG: hypothetical protein ACRDZ4_14745 [Egibacteraceae bacterium]
MQDSHTPDPTCYTSGVPGRLELISAAQAGLAEQLASRVDATSRRSSPIYAKGYWPPRPQSGWKSWPH